MKKVVYLCLFFTIFFISCATSTSNKKNTITVVMEGNPTTGYLWECKSLDESVAVCSKSEYKSDNSNKNLVGVGGKYYFTIQGISKGQTEIKFYYARPWEKDSIETKTLKVFVDSAGNISKK